MSSSGDVPLRRVLLLGGTSEIGLATLHALDLPAGAQVVLAGRDRSALAGVAAGLPARLQTSIDCFDALRPESTAAVVHRAFAAGQVDVVLPAFGVLGDQEQMTRDPRGAEELLTVNVLAQARAVLEAAAAMRRQGHGTLVVFSSIAAVRPRRANFVYGASKAALDALGQGLRDALHDTGVHVVVVRPGFVIGRMTAGMRPAPLSSTPEAVAAAVAAAVRRGRGGTVWVPASLRLLADAMRLVPRPIWRHAPR